MLTALTIASSDSSGGAGIQADIRAFSAAGVHGASAVACVTVQNSRGVHSIYSVPADILRGQLDAVFGDMTISAVKTGMLYSPQNIEIVRDALKGRVIPIVVDPVMKATTGGLLHLDNYLGEMKKLVAMASIVTPNADEAQALSGMDITDSGKAREAARKISGLGPKSVLIKGGHLGGQNSVDVLYSDGKYVEFSSPRADAMLHGAGCAYSALIAGYLAKGTALAEAVKSAKKAVSDAISTSYSIGSARLKIPDFISDEPTGVALEKNGVKSELSRALKSLGKLPFPDEMMPKSGINFSYAVPHALSLSDICAAPGKVWLKSGILAPAGHEPEFGASKHTAAVTLTAMNFDRKIRSAMNVRYSKKAIEACEAAGLSVGSFRRQDEPTGISTMEWGTAYAIRKAGSIPDIVYDKGSKDKEGMIRIMGADPDDVIKKLRKILSKYK